MPILHAEHGRGAGCHRYSPNWRSPERCCPRAQLAERDRGLGSCRGFLGTRLHVGNHLETACETSLGSGLIWCLCPAHWCCAMRHLGCLPQAGGLTGHLARAEWPHHKPNARLREALEKDRKIVDRVTFRDKHVGNVHVGFRKHSGKCSANNWGSGSMGRCGAKPWAQADLRWQRSPDSHRGLELTWEFLDRARVPVVGPVL